MNHRLYVKRDTIREVRAFGLDCYSLETLDDDMTSLATIFKQPVSQSTVCRRALRFYSEHLDSLKDREKQEAEILLILRASKGVI